MRTAHRIAAPVLAAASALVLAAGPLTAPAAAAPSPGPGTGRSLDAAKAAVAKRVELRLTSLKNLRTTVDGAARLTAAHKSALTGIIDHAQQGLTALATKVTAETTAAGVKADAQSMVDDYRVFVLVEPQVHLTVAIDLETAAAARLGQLADQESAAIDKAKAAGKDVSKAEAGLADLRSQVGAAQAAIAGKTDPLLAVKPGPDADAIHNQVKPVREAVHTARTDLHKAAADAKDIKAALGG
jgi:hypothetical protein